MIKEEVKEMFESILDAKSQFDAYGIKSTEYNLKVNEKFFECLDMAIKALFAEPCEDCIKIPEGATNGDMIKAMFPNFHTDEMSHTVWVGYDAMSFHREWWNSPYRKSRNEK